MDSYELPYADPRPVPVEIQVYQRSPGNYARVADMVAFCMWVGEQRCSRDRECEGPDYICRRHERTAELAARYARMVERRRRAR